MYILESFNNVTLPAQMPEDDLGLGQVEPALTPLMGGGAFNATGSDQIYSIGGQTLTKKFLVVGSDGQNAAELIRNLRGQKGQFGQLWRLWVDGQREWCWAWLVDMKGTRKVDNERHVSFDVTFQMTSPVWYGETQQALAAEITATSQALSLTVGGNAPVRNAVLTLSMPAAVTFPLTSVQLVKSGQSDITWETDLGAGDVLSIDAGGFTVSKNGSDAYLGASYGADHNIDEWFRFDLGPNEFTLVVAPSLPEDVGSGYATGLLGPPTYSESFVVDKPQLNLAWYEAWH